MALKTMIFVTTNKGKAREVKAILKGFRVVVKSVELHEAKHLTHEELVKRKVRDAFEAVGKPVFVEDTGLFVEGFKDYPGLRSREVYEKLGLDGFVRKCGGRKAFFRTIVGYCDGKRVVIAGKAVCRGRIAERVEKRAFGGLPYLRVFIPEGYDVPVAAFAKKDFDLFFTKLNHRAKAFRQAAGLVRANEFP